MTQILSPTPIKNSNAKIKLNHGVIPARSAAPHASAGPAVKAARVPKRSSTAPLSGMPAKRPSARAVMVCAAVPGLTAKAVAITGTAGTIIDHMPASSALVYSVIKPRAVALKVNGKSIGGWLNGFLKCSLCSHDFFSPATSWARKHRNFSGRVIKG